MQTLIEKLEDNYEVIATTPHDDDFKKGYLAGLKKAIFIAQQHCDWVSCSERLLQSSGKYLVCYSQEHYDGTYFKRFDVVDFYVGINRFDFYHSLISHWQSIQPPSEVQP